MQLKDAVVLVTGAARGLGKAIAEGFAARGCRLALVDILDEALEQTADAVRTRGARVLAARADITDAEQTATMAERVRRDLGPVRVLVNNAGSLSAIGPVWEVDPNKWTRDTTVNLVGTFLVTRAVVPQIIAAGGGYVINLVGAGVNTPHAYTSGYDCSKAGVVRLAEALAREGAAQGIRSFALFPGTVKTTMTDFIADSPEGRKWRPSFTRMFREGRDVPPIRAVEWCLHIASGEADALNGRWIDAQEDFETVRRLAPVIIRDNLHVLRLRRPEPTR